MTKETWNYIKLLVEEKADELFVCDRPAQSEVIKAIALIYDLTVVDLYGDGHFACLVSNGGSQCALIAYFEPVTRYKFIQFARRKNGENWTPESLKKESIII